MARTTPEDVATILDEVEDGIDINPYIDTASILVSAVCLNSGYTSTVLEMIERWLSAHFYVISFPRSKRLAIAGGPSEEVEPGKWDLGFNFTKYGQQALRIDYKGNLAHLEEQIGKGVVRTAETKWVGFSACSP